MFRTLAHIFLTIIGLVFWTISISLLTIPILLSILGDKIKPESKWGNCWIYAMPKWATKGGYLLIRNADGQRLFGFFPVPHVSWVSSLGKNVELKSFEPIARKSSWWMPWYVVYYKGRIKSTESNHDAKE